MTKYVVLRFCDPEGSDPNGFRAQGIQEANGPEQAVRRLVGDAESAAGIYLVMPERNAAVIEHGIEQPPPRVKTHEVSAEQAMKLFQLQPLTDGVQAVLGEHSTRVPAPLGGEDS